ncbi:MAG TPA: helix-turn-helix domain-containing protein [Rubrobacteraceae bacterium]|nr:helix-turn-helix domain-containing protein [Rubrobacteraceae bacterium]
MKGNLDSYEKQRIRALLDENWSHNSIARELGRSQSTISDFAKREGYSPLPERTPTVANRARRDFAKAERRELLNQAFETASEMLERGGLSPRELKELMTAVGITIDKARLEEGAPNSVHEARSGTPHPGVFNLEEEFGRLDKLQEMYDAEAEE